jgi:hypothetical protein
MEKTYRCRNCGHQIVKIGNRWKHLSDYECPTHNNERGKCGYTINECSEKFIAPCSYLGWVPAIKCDCGCRYPRPSYSFIKRKLHRLFGIRSQPDRGGTLS